MFSYEYALLTVSMIPEYFMIKYNLYPLVQNGCIYIDIRKGMYGLPQSGFIAQDCLQKHLAKYNYLPAPITAGLLRSKTRQIIFFSVLYDFKVKYVRQ